jgi:hypothetical protein
MIDIFNPRKKQQTLKRSTTKSVLDKNGEYTSSEEVNEYKAQIESEPHFAKTYYQDRHRLNNITKIQILVHLELSFYSGYNTNQVILNTAIKDDICDDLNIASSTLDNALIELVKHQFIARIGTGTYLLNPYHMGKGNWSENRNIRDNITYNIEYVDEANENSPIKAITFDFSLVPRFIKRHAALAKNGIINPDKPKRVKRKKIKSSSSKKTGLFTKIFNLIKRRKTVKNSKPYIHIDRDTPKKAQVSAENPVSNLPH